MRCPNCGRDLGDPTDIDIKQVGWGCPYCGLKIYKDRK